MTTSSVFLDMLFACLQLVALAGLGCGLVWMLYERARHPISDAPPPRRAEIIVVAVPKPIIVSPADAELVMPPYLAASRTEPSASRTITD